MPALSEILSEVSLFILPEIFLSVINETLISLFYLVNLYSLIYILVRCTIRNQKLFLQIAAPLW